MLSIALYTTTHVRENLVKRRKGDEREAESKRKKNINCGRASANECSNNIFSVTYIFGKWIKTDEQ